MPNQPLYHKAYNFLSVSITLLPILALGNMYMSLEMYRYFQPLPTFFHGICLDYEHALVCSITTL